VWCPGMPDWARAGHIAELKRYFQQYMPPPIRVLPSDPGVAAPVRSESSNLHPWRRYFARMIDLYIFILIFFVLLRIVFPELFAADQSRGNERGYDYLYTIIGIGAYAIFETFCLNVFWGDLWKTPVRNSDSDENARSSRVFRGTKKIASCLDSRIRIRHSAYRPYHPDNCLSWIAEGWRNVLGPRGSLHDCPPRSFDPSVVCHCDCLDLIVVRLRSSYCSRVTLSRD
jgi:hypothetical protein